MEAVDGILSRLPTDHLDSLLLHRPRCAIWNQMKLQELSGQPL
ncbi:MAG: hypothetical protein ACLTER_23890 [Ruminococcus sp.]